MGRRLVPVGGKMPQMRPAAKNAWSNAKAQVFLSVLADTLNVSEAVRQSGLSSVAVYRRRKTDAAFRAGWLDAVGEAYRKLELVLLERAFNGTEKIVRRRDGSEERMREYPDSLALQLLKMHRGTAVESETDEAMSPGELDDIRERVIRKLQRLKARDEATEAGPQQLRDGNRGGAAAEPGLSRSAAEGDRDADG